ncbi:MAG: endonuclease/exonuclease/phosphatase family protein [Gemmatimonadota bacterium]
MITWNCKGAFERKHAAIVSLKPDVLVVPEAARISELSHVLGESPVNSVEWIGENPRKGLAVISYGDYSLTLHEAYDPRLRWILPLEVLGPSPFTLIAVSAMPDTSTGRYIQCLVDACETYRDLLASSRVVLAGDFNNHVVFDSPRKPMKFVSLLATLGEAGFQSLYHLERGCAHGEESDPTFFLYHRVQHAHHIDFIFAKSAMIAPGFKMTVGDHTRWGKSSDHMPLTCAFDESTPMI